MNATSVLEKDDKEEQDPTVMLWLMYFISHHYLFKKDVENSLKFVN